MHQSATPTHERTLDSPLLRGVPISERSESTDRGASAERLAQELSRRIVSSKVPSDSKLLAYSVTFTVPVEHRAEMSQHVGRFGRQLECNLLGGGAILSLDKPDGSEHVHVHGLVLAAARLSPAKLIKWWRRGFVGALPVSRAQKIRLLPTPADSGFRVAVYRTLKHALSREREGGRQVELMALGQRVTAAGTLSSLWDSVALNRGVYRVNSQSPSCGALITTSPSTKPPRLLGQGCCPWCTKPLPRGGRRDRRFCKNTCQVAANRALRKLQKANAAFDRDGFEQLVAGGWNYREALRFIAKGTAMSEWAVPTMCRCGKPLASRIDATTCGKGACREYQRRRDWGAQSLRIIAAIRSEQGMFTTRQLLQRNSQICLVAPVLYEALVVYEDIGFIDARGAAPTLELQEFAIAERQSPSDDLNQSQSITINT